MSDSFETSGIIVLQPGSATIPYSFTFAAATSATSNDGSIPYGSTISSAVVKVFDAGKNDVTTEIIVGSTPVTGSGLIITVSMKYPATSGTGNYSIEFVLTLNTSAVLEVDYTRVYAKDISA